MTKRVAMLLIVTCLLFGNLLVAQTGSDTKSAEHKQDTGLKGKFYRLDYVLRDGWIERDQ
jgi:hypothetical protein